MSVPLRSLRLLPKPKSELDRLYGNKGEIFYDSTSGSLRLFDGAIPGGTQLNVSVSISDTPPSYPTQGSLWFNSATGAIYLYYQDISSSQWVAPIVPAGGVGGGGGVSTFNGGTVSGSTTFTNTVTITGQIRSPASADQNVIAFHFDDQSQFPAASTYHGAIIHSHADARMYMAHGGSWKAIANLTDITNYTLPTASTSELGGVKIDGVTLALNGSGQLYYTGGGAGGYSLPIAGVGAGGTLGGVKVDGTSITISSGVISASATSYTLPTASTTVKGGVIIPLVATSGITNTSGTIGIAVASSSQLGGVKIDGSTITLNGSNQLVANYTNYTLPTATNTVLGGVRVDGTSITITSGTIAVPAVATIGQTNGIATLGSDGKLTAGQIPSSLTGAVVFKGTWNASTNTPTLADGSGTAGWQYAVSVGGTRNLGSGNITFVAGDYVIYNGTIWQQIPSSTIAAAGTLTGATLASNVLSSSLTSVGTLTALTVTNTITGSVSGNAGTVTNGVVTTGSYSDPSWLTLTKSKVGLGNVDNTTDAGKPVSTLTQAALDLKAPKADPTFSGTVTLGAVGNVSITGGSTGQVLTTNGSGMLSWASASTYTLPTANSSTLGGIKIGTGLSIDGSGVVSASAGATNLDGLSDVVVSSATAGQILLYTGSNFVNYTSRLFHQFAYPAITALDVTNSGATAYLFNNQYSGNNPTIYAISGTTIAFNLSVVGHPFLIRTSGGVNYNTGLIHVDVDGTVSTGTSAQGKTAGTLYWQIPPNTIGNYQYICSIHSGMVGVITIKSILSMA